MGRQVGNSIQQAAQWLAIHGGSGDIAPKIIVTFNFSVL